MSMGEQAALWSLAWIAVSAAIAWAWVCLRGRRK